MSKPKTSPRYSPEVRERTVRMVLEQTKDHQSQWAATESVAAKIGCAPQTLNEWIRRAETDARARPGLTTDERAKMKAMEREIKDLRQANEILKKASAYFALAERAKEF